MSSTTVQNCFKKDGFSGMEQDDESDYPFSTLKHIEQLQSQDETLVPMSHVLF